MACERCGASFRASHGKGQRFCSPECGYVHRGEQSALKPRPAPKRHPPGTGLRTCSKCGETKPANAFAFRGGRRSGRQCVCRLCTRLARLQREYGVSADEYAATLAAQGGVCAICRQRCRTHEFLSVDHNHATGEVRGLLCRACNTGIGAFSDSLERLRAAIGYLS